MNGITISEGLLLTLALGGIGWYIKYLISKTNKNQDKQSEIIALALDNNTAAINELKIAIAKINTGCDFKHEMINKRLSILDQTDKTQGDHLAKLDTDIAVIKHELPNTK